MIEFQKATDKDAEVLARISKRAFHSDVEIGGPEADGPPGYDSARWQSRMMGLADYYKILLNGHIVGGLILSRMRPQEYELRRVFIDPEVQRQGIGTQACEFLWKTYPLAKRWKLDTPAWNVRTRRFYAKMGFVEIGENEHGLILFERQL